VGYLARIVLDGRGKPTSVRSFHISTGSQLGATPGPIFNQLQVEGLARSGTLSVALNWPTSGRLSLPPKVHPGPIIALVGVVLDCVGRLLADLVVGAVGIAREVKKGK
jgi:hypothetical protein